MVLAHQKQTLWIQALESGTLIAIEVTKDTAVGGRTKGMRNDH